MRTEWSPTISVIVPSYNAGRTLPECLEGLCRQQTEFRFDITVVDSSPGGVPKELERPGVRVCQLSSRHYPGQARNVGLQLTRAPYVAFVDADCVVGPGFLQLGVETLKSGLWAGVGAAIVNGTGGVVAWLRYLSEFKEYMPEAKPRAVWTLPAAAVCYRRDVLERLGGFSDLRTGEDLLLNWRLHESGGQLLFDPRMVATHLTPGGWAEWLRYQHLLGFNSGVVRRLAGLPGQAAVRHPALSWLLPLARTARAFWWLGRFAPRQALYFTMLWPAYLAGCIPWARGFRAGLAGGAEVEVGRLGLGSELAGCGKNDQRCVVGR